MGFGVRARKAACCTARLLGPFSRPSIIFCGASSFEAKLEHEPALQHRGVPKLDRDPREEAVEHEKLPLPGECAAHFRGRPESLFERLLEGFGRGVVANRHAPRPPNGF